MRYALFLPYGEAPLPPLVMAGPDPAIQTRRDATAARTGWMAASMAGLNPAIRAAMTSWVQVHKGAERETDR